MAPIEASALEATFARICRYYFFLVGRLSSLRQFTLLDFGSSVDFGAWSSGSGGEVPAKLNPTERTCTETAGFLEF